MELLNYLLLLPSYGNFLPETYKIFENALLEKIIKHLKHLLIVLLYYIVSIYIDKNKEEK